MKIDKKKGPELVAAVDHLLECSMRDRPKSAYLFDLARRGASSQGWGALAVFFYRNNRGSTYVERARQQARKSFEDILALSAVQSAALGDVRGVYRAQKDGHELSQKSIDALYEAVSMYPRGPAGESDLRLAFLLQPSPHLVVQSLIRSRIRVLDDVQKIPHDTKGFGTYCDKIIALLRPTSHIVPMIHLACITTVCDASVRRIVRYVVASEDRSLFSSVRLLLEKYDVSVSLMSQYVNAAMDCGVVWNVQTFEKYVGQRPSTPQRKEMQNRYLLSGKIIEIDRSVEYFGRRFRRSEVGDAFDKLIHTGSLARALDLFDEVSQRRKKVLLATAISHGILGIAESAAKRLGSTLTDHQLILLSCNHKNL